MEKKTSLDKLIGNVKQYHTKRLLPPDDFIGYFNKTLEELQITNKIDTNIFKQDLIKYLKVIDWFGDIGRLIAISLFDKGLKIDIFQSEGDKLQYGVNTQDFTNYIITGYLDKRHKEYFHTPVPSLNCNGGVKPNNMKGDWHMATHDGGIKTPIETIVSVLIEFERSYVKQLEKEGSLPELTRIREIFNNAELDNHKDLTALQVLDEITYLYIQQYELSSILKYFRRNDMESLSPNIDKIFELYSDDKDKRVRKMMGLIKILDPNTIHVTSKRAKNIKSKLTATENDIITEITQDSKDTIHDAAAVSDTKKELSTVSGEHQALMIAGEPEVTHVANTAEIPPSVEDILEKYCEEKISDDLYKVIEDYFIMKKGSRFILKKFMGIKVTGKGDDAVETEEYKEVSQKPFFVVARTQHLEEDTQGVRLASIGDIINNTYEAFSLGDLGNSSFVKRLNNKGYKVKNKKLAEDYINILEEVTDKQVFISNNVGWVNHNGLFGFVLPTGKGIGITGLEYSGKNPNIKNAISRGGNLNKWLSIFDVFNLDKAHPRLQFLLFSSLLPLFAEYYPLFSGITINIGPDDSEEKKSSNGKSIMLRLLLSVQGNSTESSSSWFGNWKINLQGLEKSLYTCVGSYHDDTSIRDDDFTDKVIENSIYSISTGKARTTSVKEGKDRRTVLFSSGESEILGHNAKDGAYARFINVGIKRSDYGSDKTKEIVDHIERISKEHYGFVYPVAIRIMLENKEAIFEEIDIYQNQLLETYKHDLAVRLAKQYALIAVCGNIFIESLKMLSKGKYNFDNIDSFEVAREMFIVHDEKLQRMDAAKKEQPSNLLQSILDNFEENSQSELFDGSEKVGFIKDGHYHILAGKIKNYLPSGMTKQAFTKEMNKLGRLIEKSKAITQNKKTERYDVFRKIDER